MRDIHGEFGRVWLERLPHHIRACEAQWGIQVNAPFQNLTYNVVAPAVGADGTPYVLKMGPPDEQLEREARALAFYQGKGIVRLIASDLEIAALLLERLEPGVSRWHAQDDEDTTRIAASLMKRLWRPVPDPQAWRSLESWAEALTDVQKTGPATAPLPEHLIDKAQGLLKEHLGSTPPVLLHADLHHDNILSATREPYLAIDPKGIAGDAGYDVGPFLINPMPDIRTWPNLRKVLERRVMIFAEMLELDVREVAAWGVIHAVLSACWSVDEHGEGWESAIACAMALEPLT
jgi:streptomycin 6-kinase